MNRKQLEEAIKYWEENARGAQLKTLIEAAKTWLAQMEELPMPISDRIDEIADEAESSNAWTHSTLHDIAKEVRALECAVTSAIEDRDLYIRQVESLKGTLCTPLDATIVIQEAKQTRGKYT